MIWKEEYQGSETKGVVRGWCFVDLDHHFKTPIALGSMQIDDGELHLKPAHAVPLASARQHPEPKRKTRPTIRRSSRWRPGSIQIATNLPT